MKEKSKFYMGCHLAGRKYHEADLVWDRLRVGMPLRLEREADNRYDPEAVQVIFTSDGEDYLLGYIPRGDNRCLAPFFDMGHDDLFDCRISRIAPEEHPEEQIQLTVRIREKCRCASNFSDNKTDDIYPEREQENNRQISKNRKR